MTREEFVALPSRVALGIVYDASAKIQEIVTRSEAPRAPKPPKYDGRQYRKGGWNYYSEMDLGSLQYWQKRAVEGSESGSEYADKDAKRAKALSFWIEWRKWQPECTWTGERDDQVVTAKPPTSNPELHSKLEANNDWVSGGIDDVL